MRRDDATAGRTAERAVEGARSEREIEMSSSIEISRCHRLNRPIKNTRTQAKMAAKMKRSTCILLIYLALLTLRDVYAFSTSPYGQRSQQLNEHNDDDARMSRAEDGASPIICIDRRSLLSRTLTAAAASLSVAVAPLSASAADTSTTTSAVTPQDLLARLRRVPCFAVVDKDGIPYIIVDQKTRFGTGYFFLTFRGALTVLEEAQQKAKAEGYEKVWEGARITTVPMDIAVRLSLKKVERSGQNNLKLDTIADILPGMEERDDALKLDRSGRFNEQGSCPLFYVEEGMEAEDGSLPTYFSTATLAADWDRIYGGKKPLPAVKVVDLLDLFQSAMRGKARINPSFVATEESMEVVKELQSRSLNVPYKADRMVMVGGKS